jgi:hypothetical protein
MENLWKTVTKRVKNPLSYPFLIATAAYGIGFTVFAQTAAVHQSSLFMALSFLHPFLPYVWGAACLIAIVVAFVSLIKDHEPGAKTAGWIGFMTWLFAAICWIITGGFLTLFAIAIPNMWFWLWQYFNLRD